jgi:hypothetical protein
MEKTGRFKRNKFIDAKDYKSSDNNLIVEDYMPHNLDINDYNG